MAALAIDLDNTLTDADGFGDKRRMFEHVRSRWGLNGPRQDPRRPRS